MSNHNLVSVSGGKDSTATLLLAIEREAENLTAVFADTGHEHPATYEYVDYLERKTGVQIRRVTPDFSAQIARKREVVQTKWRRDGVGEDVIERALSVLTPTGNPFLDLCLWKGRFPSTKARFCTDELKVFPVNDQVVWPMLRAGKFPLDVWQGIRWDESKARANAVEREGADPDATRVFAYRPILSWSAEEVFDFHIRHGVRWNPLYENGMTRVGCMPCISCRKDELRAIVTRFPEQIDRVREWEALVAKASKHSRATFFPPLKSPDCPDGTSIDDAAKWSLTLRGGRDVDPDAEMGDATECSSAYGLCDPYSKDKPPLWPGIIATDAAPHRQGGREDIRQQVDLLVFGA